MEAVREQISKTFTQFELTKHLLQNLKNFNLTPVAKLVLLELSSHYNEEKNNAVVFPSTPYIAETLGIGLTAAKKAINDLVNEGLIIKSKRDKVRGNYNKYLFTNKVRNTTSEQPGNELFKSTKSDRFMITNNKKTKKEQTTVVSLENFSFKGAEEKPVKKASSTTASGFSKAGNLPVNIPQMRNKKPCWLLEVFKTSHKRRVHKQAKRAGQRNRKESSQIKSRSRKKTKRSFTASARNRKQQKAA